MIAPQYSVALQSDVMTVVWTYGGLTLLMRGAGAAALALAALIFFRFRGKLWRVPAAIFCAASAAALLLASFTPPPTHRWVLGPEGIRIDSPGGTWECPWTEVESVRVDAEAGPLEKAPLILKRTGGGESWIFAGWLVREHRRDLVRALARFCPEGMRPVLERGDYLEALRFEKKDAA